MPDMPETVVPEDWKRPRKAKIVPPQETAEPAPESPEEAATEERKPQFGEGVRFVDNREKDDQILDAVVMVAFADGDVNLRVLDPENPYGHFDVARPAYDVEKHPGTWHYPED